MIQTEVIAANRCNVVGLRGVRQPVVFGQENAFFREVLNVGILIDLREVLENN